MLLYQPKAPEFHSKHGRSKLLVRAIDTTPMKSQRRSFGESKCVSSDDSGSELERSVIDFDNLTDYCSGEEDAASSPVLRRSNSLRRAIFKASPQRGDDMGLDYLDSLLVQTEEDLNDKYDLGEVLGDGATCSVRIATNRSTLEKVAVKIIDIRQFRRNQSLCREVNILRNLHHPNIVQLKDVILTSQNLYIFMELACGMPLFDAILSANSHTEEKARTIIKKILSALEYLHSEGIAHRDLKPENILYATNCSDSEIKLVDFGLAKSWSEEGYRTPTGTLGYKAPEIFKQESYDMSVDMWALGVISYILLCGFPPFFSFSHYKENNILGNAPFWVFFNNETETLKQEILAANITFPDPFWTKISDEAKDFVSSLLRKDPKTRLTASEALNHDWFADKPEPLRTRSLSSVVRILKTSYASQGQSIERGLTRRPSPREMRESGILKSPQKLSPCLHAAQVKLMRANSKDDLGKKLRLRPSADELIKKKILLPA